MADQDTEPTESQKTSTAIADVYKQMKQDKQDALEERLRSSKEKA